MIGLIAFIIYMILFFTSKTLIEAFGVTIIYLMFNKLLTSVKEDDK